MRRKPNYLLKRTVPCIPLVPEEREDWIPGPRLGQCESLDSHGLGFHMRKNSIRAHPFGDGDMDQFHTIAALSRYHDPGEDGTKALHLMTMNLGRRFCPNLAWFDESVGLPLTQVWAKTATAFMEMGMSHLRFGWNSSPIGYGTLEMRYGGGQSIATRHHMMEGAYSEETAEEIACAELSPAQRRVFGDNDYVRPFSEYLHEILSEIILQSGLFDAEPIYSPTGLDYRSHLSLPEFFTSPNCFSKLKEVTIAIEDFFRHVTETVTMTNYDAIFAALKKTEKGIAAPFDDHEKRAEKFGQAEWELINAEPRLRYEEFDAAKEAFVSEGLPLDILSVIWAPVVARCTGSGPVEDRWRHGFANSALLMDDGEGTTMRIATFVYLASCGMVEGESIWLKRPTSLFANPKIIRAQSNLCWQLAEHLK